MKVAAIIAVYNPFHNGHKYHIEKTKELTGADYIIAIISGNYVQRGTPAIIDKYSRTKMALSNGVDLVIELPTCYATASAEYFAYGAVSILNQLGVVDYLCFGSECADIDTLHYIANILVKNPPEFSRILNKKIRSLALISSEVKRQISYRNRCFRGLTNYQKEISQTPSFRDTIRYYTNK